MRAGRVALPPDDGPTAGIRCADAKVCNRQQREELLEQWAQIHDRGHLVRNEGNLRPDPAALRREPADPTATQKAFRIGLDSSFGALPPDVERVEPGLQTVRGGLANYEHAAPAESLLPHRAADLAPNITGDDYLERGARELGGEVARRGGLENQESVSGEQ
jgi:hypothetical protein